MTTDPSAKLKAAKNSLVASLFELSKSANQTASSIVDFYNSVGDDEEEKLEAFTTLTESLQTLTSATSNINEIGMDLIHGTSNDALKDETNDASSPSSSNAHSKKKRAEKDPNAPKKPLTVFFAYSAFARQQLRADRENEGLPPLSSTEITQEISKKWKVLDEEEKDKWRAAYNVELEHYQMEKQKYLESKKNR
ncbi:hypothetical protein TBLA_0A01170 [Henningerozyma blattae CBS 6284]|uniref:HMG box domain-containing protein n=1 Tax=Henningerozyma blattae (strain ATCC 34711 / CBS 6284 / DSM 70876 / NBRC 10599 / NRRL Y-10934 / UCD 77-7) TaxID=1071380 RepID=I2GUW5_HENB6|nr:hypothetical protein TBLA_0A01170 [Tetrapisispora blattae CBS 6284]CCH57917.1 hypothetical protein TBLA_0A01170 [Tetrapisispora blattae CBS 6284]